MAQEKPELVQDRAKLANTLYLECKAMINHAINAGKPLDVGKLSVIESSIPAEKLKPQDLLPVYNYLIEVVKPATPGTLRLFEENRQRKSIFRKLGPLPIVQEFMVIAIISLTLMIVISLSPWVNPNTIQLSMLQGNGWPQVLRLTFLVAASAVGGSFYALFKMNGYISEGTFDTKYVSIYRSRFVLGLVAGLLLSELFVTFIEPSVTDMNSPVESAGYLLKPILAILGGFSANLVYRVLNRLVETVEGLFKGSSEEILYQQKNSFQLKEEVLASSMRSESTQALLSLKNQLVNQGASQDMISTVDQALSKYIPSPNVPPTVISDPTEDTPPDVFADDDEEEDTNKTPGS